MTTISPNRRHKLITTIHTICLFVFSLAFIIINGCNPSMVPLKGKYIINSTEVTLNASIDSTWAQIDRLFTINGLPIKKFDKSTGVIITRKTAFNPLYTFEDEAGQLQEGQAWIVLPKTFSHGRQWRPQSIYSQWHIDISEISNNTTSIKIDPVVLCTYYPNSFGRIETQGQSTRKFEELIKTSLFSNLPK